MPELNVVLLAFAVVILVYLLSMTKLLPSGNWKRSATIILSLLLSGANASDPKTIALSAAVLVLATGIHEVIEFTIRYARKARK